MFWLLALPLLLLGGAFAAAPFLRCAPKAASQRSALLRALYRQRLAELDDEARTGLLEAGEREEMEAELGQALLQDWTDAAAGQAEADAEASGRAQAGEEREMDATTARAAVHPASLGRLRGAEREAGAAVASTGKASAWEAAAKSGQKEAGTTAAKAGKVRPVRGWAWLIAGLAVPLAATGLYLGLGEPDAALLAEAPRAMGLDPGKDRIELDGWRALLGKRVQVRPDEAGSWFLLGHIYMTDQDYAAAAAAFAKVHDLLGDEAGIDVSWLQARYLAADGRLDAEGAALAERILARTPNQSTALEILALDAYGRADFPAAAALFNRALANPMDALRRRVLQGAFDRARTQLDDAPAIEVAVSTTAPPPAAATLFVVARPPGGGMPYAVVRRPATVLPTTIRLDAAVSMNPTRPLSMADSVEVLARISLVGTATVHPGDWQWRSPALALDEASMPLALAAEIRPPE